MRMTNGMMNASWTKSCGDVRSHTRYHFVKGTCPFTAPPGVPEGANEGIPELEESTIEAGAGSGAPAKSAKSRSKQERSQHPDNLRSIAIRFQPRKEAPMDQL